MHPPQRREHVRSRHEYRQKCEKSPEHESFRGVSYSGGRNREDRRHSHREDQAEEYSVRVVAQSADQELLNRGRFGEKDGTISRVVIEPKQMEPGQQYFEGEVWVDDKDFQIVKTYGRGEGKKKSEDNQYPKFETYREQVDGKYWFPTYTIANATLHFRDRDQRMRMTVKYEDYKQFKSDTVIKYGDVDDPNKPTPPPPKKP